MRAVVLLAALALSACTATPRELAEWQCKQSHPRAFGDVMAMTLTGGLGAAVIDADHKEIVRQCTAAAGF